MPFFLPPKLPEESLSPRAKFDWIEEEEEERRRRDKQKKKIKHQREFFVGDDVLPSLKAREEEEGEEKEVGEEGEHLDADGQLEDPGAEELASFRLGRRG